MGYKGGLTNTGGANSIVIGSSSDTTGSSNCIVLGISATPKSNNQLVLGSSTVQLTTGASATSGSVSFPVPFYN